MVKTKSIYKKVLVIGSGPIIIGQAAEFDYAGTQACLALKDEGIKIVLVNNNPATIMTDEGIADFVYFEPLTLASITKIIERERPDALLPTLGGQTGLNLALQLDQAGILKKHDVIVLGTTIASIKKGEDRELFKKAMAMIGEPVPDSITTDNIEVAVKFANTIGFPVIVRPAYTLGGTGGGKAETSEELMEVVSRGLAESPIRQVLIDRSLLGWKEIEYEVMRDKDGNSIIVCSMENIDPLGIHTGDSIVVAPSQTLNDKANQLLRTSSLKIIEELKIIGGCNIQFALHPDGDRYYIIEVNPRVSRSSALASKATGYPIAKIATKLAIGYLLDEIKNPITKSSYASIEPVLDYIVVKIPRFPFDKFPYINRILGTQMKATGEIMTIDSTFERAFYKAIRGLEIDKYGLIDTYYQKYTDEEIEVGIREADDRRIFFIAEALNRGISVQLINEWSSVDMFFLHKFQGMVGLEQELYELSKGNTEITDEQWRKFKAKGISDKLISDNFNISSKELWDKWKQLKITPSFKSVNTNAVESEAITSYFYSSSHGIDDEECLVGKKIAILGSGSIRIGQGIEFDYCSVHTALTMRDEGIQSIIINNNPETVSTDYQMSSRLYMEPLTLEDIIPIIEKEQVDGVIYQVGGQTSIKLAKELEPYVKLLGTSLSLIDDMEDREKFNKFLQRAGIEPILGKIIWETKDLDSAIKEIEYPFLIRPSYVIGGQCMRIINNEAELFTYIDQLDVSLTDKKIYPLLVDKFIQGKEVEVDIVSDGDDWIIPAIMEHVEPAGVHSGDSTAVIPTYSLTDKQKKDIIIIIEKILKQDKFIGLVNIQMIVDNDKIYVLEINPRASRTIPIISKVTGIPMIKIATKVQMGIKLKSLNYPLGLLTENEFYTVKAPIFSNKKLVGISEELGPEMKSTGEIMAVGWTLEEALEKVKPKPNMEVIYPKDLCEYKKHFIKGGKKYAQ